MVCRDCPYRTLISRDLAGPAIRFNELGGAQGQQIHKKRDDGGNELITAARMGRFVQEGRAQLLII